MVSLARSRWVLAPVLLALIAGVWWARRRPPQYSEAYVGDRTAILWDTTAQVRRPLTTLPYGERLTVMRRSGNQAEVQSEGGAHGWIDAHELMEPALWKRSADLLAKAREMPVQARGHTRALSNVHVEPGRDAPRLFQFGRDVPVAVLLRKVTAAPKAGDAEGEPATTDGEAPSKVEDWLFVLRAGGEESGGVAAGTNPVSAPGAQTGADTPIAGWVLAQFIELDPPSPIPDYAGSSGMRVVAWAVLNRVTDPSGGDKPQYVVAGLHGVQSPECDFTALRVLTWGGARQRYETAYIENDLCGSLPLRVHQTANGADFRFAEVDEGNVERIYRMQQTSVRRVRPGESSRR